MGSLSDAQNITGSGSVLSGGQTVGNASAVATLAASGTVVPKTTYIRGFAVTGLGATAAGSVDVVISGLAGGNLTFTIAIPAGVTVGITPFYVDFTFAGLAGSAPNTAVVVTVPAFGAGNTKATVAAWGYQA